jgi:phosphopantothenate---cysteine ligase (CTP)
VLGNHFPSGVKLPCPVHGRGSFEDTGLALCPDGSGIRPAHRGVNFPSRVGWNGRKFSRLCFFPLQREGLPAVHSPHPMIVIVTIGPTQEPLDAMRILTNRSTGELGTLLAASLAEHGHEVIALRGKGSTASEGMLDHKRIRTIPFTTTDDLQTALEGLAREGGIRAVYHAAAVSDFYLPGAGTGKIPTAAGSLTLTLEPTPKLLPRMRGWFPEAVITGWKFEATGNRDHALSAGRSQIAASGTDACVVNGPSFGEGFGVISRDASLVHLPDRPSLCAHLTEGLLPLP